MPDFVRVEDKDTGHKLTVQRSELSNETYREIDEPAVNELGDPLPPEHKSRKPQSSGSTKGQQATDKKEN